ncbi:hypothetical protein AB9E14_23795 [Rhizobium leguminosarum]|uniref:hypothetical protein n=1 Tax=Rhizobium leguminosarum TaxID=384 RepID=UPI003F952239
MKASDIPSETFPIPFADSAGGGYIHQVPVASQIGITNGAASLTDGFPPLNFLPVGSGGVPPFGQDMNGILNQVTQWTRWQNAGGLAQYDSAFSTAIGGYPEGTLLAGTTAGVVYLCIVDDNTTNPNSGGAGWIVIGTSSAILNNSYTYAPDTGTATALVATLAPVPTAYVTGMEFVVKTANAAVGAATINLNGLGAKSIVDQSGAPIIPGFWQAGDFLTMLYDGTSVRVIGGNTISATLFSSTNGNTQSLTNNNPTTVLFATAGGSTNFGTYTTSVFTFTRSGVYAISAAIVEGLTFTGTPGTSGILETRKNATPIIGSHITSQSSQASPVSFPMSSTVIATVLAGDQITIVTNIVAASGFTAASATSVSLSITPIS